MGRSRVGLPDDIFGINRGNMDVSRRAIDREPVGANVNSTFGQRLAYNSGFGSNPTPGTDTDWIPRTDEKGIKEGILQVVPNLGSFILLGCGLLTLAGWGRRKYRK